MIYLKSNLQVTEGAKMTEIIKAFGIVALTIVMLLGAALILIPISLYYAWVISILWGWFMVPVGLPALTTI